MSRKGISLVCWRRLGVCICLFGEVKTLTFVYRELAYQIADQFSALGSGIGVRVATIVGGMDTMSQQVALAKKPHIIVATPGRLQDHLENTKGFSLRTLKYLVRQTAAAGFPHSTNVSACRSWTKQIVSLTSISDPSSTRFSKSSLASNVIHTSSQLR